MEIIDSFLLADLTSKAKRNPRRRQNYNLHASLDEPSQRLLNAMEPNSYIRPHRHLKTPKPEGFIALRGKLAFLAFDDNGKVDDIIIFGPNESAFGVDLPTGVWHTVISLETGSVFYETKPGPYIPTAEDDLAPWAPEEGSDMAEQYLESLARLAVTHSRTV